MIAILDDGTPLGGGAPGLRAGVGGGVASGVTGGPRRYARSPSSAFPARRGWPAF